MPANVLSGRGIARKIATARRLVSGDVRGVLKALREQEYVSRTGSFLRYWTKQHDYKSVGRVAAAVTETVVVEGHRFNAPRHLVDNELRCRFLFGRYERAERELLHTYIEPERPVIELGGGLGVIACLINRRLHDPARHVVVEANPSLLPVIDANRRRNDARFAIVHGAIAYGGTTVGIKFGTDCLSTTAGHPEGDLRVPALRLRDLFAEFPYDGCVLVCDIEGSETDLVANEADVLQARVATLVLEEHPEMVSADQRAAMFDILRDVGFRRCAQRGDSHVLRNQRLTRDAVSPDREPGARRRS
jgi:FkbM family methyltransferase